MVVDDLHPGPGVAGRGVPLVTAGAFLDVGRTAEHGPRDRVDEVVGVGIVRQLGDDDCRRC